MVMSASILRKIHFLLPLVSLCAGWSFSAPGPYLQQVTQPVLHGEGPHWDTARQVLYFVDISGKSVHRYSPQDGRTASTFVGKEVGLVVPLQNSPNGFLIGADRDLGLLQWDGFSSQSRLTVLASVEADKPGNRFNDGKADARGVLWLGTIGFENSSGVVEGEANLYHYNTGSCTLTRDLSGITVSNGIAWTYDNRIMYYIDTPTKRIDAFDYDIAQSKISNRRPVFDYQKNNIPGVPDGMTIDTDGNLWIACYLGSRVIKVDPRSGTLLMSVILPAEKVTSVQFGGINLDTLFVTTSRRGLNSTELQSQPMAGSVFAVTQIYARGLPARRAALCSGQSNYSR